jgi:hypothetical protein
VRDFPPARAEAAEATDEQLAEFLAAMIGTDSGFTASDARDWAQFIALPRAKAELARQRLKIVRTPDAQ